jgi:hypothetical protein
LVVNCTYKFSNWPTGSRRGRRRGGARRGRRRGEARRGRRRGEAQLRRSYNRDDRWGQERGNTLQVTVGATAKEPLVKW